MTGVANGVEKACLLTLGDGAEIEEHRPTLNARDYRRVARSQGTGPRRFRVLSGREWWTDTYRHRRYGLHRHASYPDERLGSHNRGDQTQHDLQYVHQPSVASLKLGHGQA